MFLRLIAEARQPVTSPVAAFETGLAVMRISGWEAETARDFVAELLAALGIAQEAVTASLVAEAVSAFARFGRGAPPRGAQSRRRLRLRRRPHARRRPAVQGRGFQPHRHRPAVIGRPYRASSFRPRRISVSVVAPSPAERVAAAMAAEAWAGG